MQLSVLGSAGGTLGDLAQKDPSARIISALSPRYDSSISNVEGLINVKAKSPPTYSNFAKPHIIVRYLTQRQLRSSLNMHLQLPTLSLIAACVACGNGSPLPGKSVDRVFHSLLGWAAHEMIRC